MLQNLIEQVRNSNAILFVGAGVSKNLGLPSWGELIAKMAEELDYAPDVFELLGDHLSLAEYYKLTKANIGQLRSQMDTSWHNPSIRIENSEIHHLIVKLNFPIIYTTNFDRWLEKAFEYYKKPFLKVSNAKDLTGLRDGHTQIVKFHGDFDDDASLVFTESSYFERLGFESPLDIKLRADALGKTILFIGYSLTDINIRYLLYRLQKLWQSSIYAEARPKSYILLSKPNPVQEVILQSRGIIPINPNCDDSGEGLRLFLSDILEKVAKI